MPIKIFLFVLFIITSINANQQLEKVSLQLLWKHQFEFAGFYMAKEKGLYKNLGLEVSFKEYEIGSNISQDVAAGKSDFGVGYSGIILDKINGTDIKLLNAIYQSSPHVLVSLESSKINSIKDFKNKRISMTDSHSKTANIKSMIYSKGIALEDMEKASFEYGIDKLINKEVDIQSIYLSNELFKLQEKNIPYKVWDPKDYGFSFYDNILFTSSTLTLKNPELVKKFQQASLMGWEYAFNNIDETIEIILKKYNSLNKSKEALLYEAEQLKKLAYFNTNKIGKIEQIDIQRIIDIYNLMGLVKNKIDIDEFIYDPYAKKILLTQQEKKYLETLSTLKVHNESNWPPYNYFENNIPKGYSIDYIKLLAKKLNLNIEFITGPSWAEFLEMAKENKIDLMLNIVKNKERSEYLEFTDSYKSHTNSLFSNQENLNTLEDLKGKSIAVPKGFFIEFFLKKHYQDIEVHTYKDLLECIHAVIEGKSDAVIASFPVIDHLLKQNNLSIKYVKLDIDKRLNFDLRLAVSKEKKILKDILNKAMQSLSDKELNELSSKWLGSSKNNTVSKVNLNPLEKEYLKQNKITMCIDPNWMPFEKFENEKYIGISADYFRIFERNLGKKIDLVYTDTWPESLEYAKQRKCDLLSLAMETPKRKEFMNFTTPYLSVPLVIATKINVTFINDIKSLQGKKIGIPKGYAFVEIFKEKYPFLNIIEVDNLDSGLQQVNNGKLFGYIGTLASVGYMFQTKYTGELKIAGKFDEKWELGIGVRNDRDILLNIMEKTVKSIDATEHQSILNNWLAIKYEQKVDFQYLLEILSVMGLILFLFLYRQYLLHQANKNLQSLVDEKTKELTELNKNLEIKIEAAIKENKSKERLLFEQSKMAAMGEMIGNISHQWRQPLSIISTAASGIKMKIEYDLFKKEEEVKTLDNLVDAANYLSSTIDDFRDFLKPNKQKENCNLKTIIEKNINMFGDSFTNHSIEFVLDIKDINIYGNQNELLQVIINILNNSKDALKECSGKKYIFINTIQKKDNVIIEIKDNGEGIEKDVLEKIFDPYFTTKHKSMGTGIGLYMSYQIIKNSFDGDILASNETFTHKENQYTGAKFEIILPLHKNI